MRKLIAVAALLFAAACSAPQPATSPQLMNEWSFQPPRGWESFTLKGPFGLPTPPNVRSWRTSNPPRLITLDVIPQQRRSNQQPAIFGPFPDGGSHVTLCHGLQALIDYKHFERAMTETITMQQPGSIAIASYSYPRFSSPDPSAEAAIRSLCPRH